MSKDNEIISHDEVRNILDIYGGSPDAWPINMRNKIHTTISTSEDLLQKQMDAIALDKLLIEHKNYAQTETDDIQALSEHIIATLPEQNNVINAESDDSKFFGWLQSWLLQPVPIAMIAVTALSISLINIQNTDSLISPQTNEEKLFEEWAWLDATDQPLSDQNDPFEYGFMDLLELEVNDV